MSDFFSTDRNLFSPQSEDSCPSTGNFSRQHKTLKLDDDDGNGAGSS